LVAGDDNTPNQIPCCGAPNLSQEAQPSDILSLRNHGQLFPPGGYSSYGTAAPPLMLYEMGVPEVSQRLALCCTLGPTNVACVGSSRLIAFEVTPGSSPAPLALLGEVGSSLALLPRGPALAPVTSGRLGRCFAPAGSPLLCARKRGQSVVYLRQPGVETLWGHAAGYTSDGRSADAL
jgi:hypothetical protein